MGRLYTYPFNGVITAAGGDVDLFNFSPATNKPILLRHLTLGQISEIADAGEEGLRITIRRLAATVTDGTGGAPVTAGEVKRGVPASGATVRSNDATTVATTTGTNRILEEIGWNNRNTPYEKWWLDEQYAYDAIAGERLIIRQETTLIDDMTFAGFAIIEEAG